MSNEFFNFTLPRFQEKHGEDWTDFMSVINTNVDHTFEKIWDLYALMDIDRMSARVVQYLLDSNGIPYDENDTVFTKKLRLRNWVSQQKGKALEDQYLDIGEQITGVVGELHSGKDIGVWRWSYSRWAGEEVTTTGLARWSTVFQRWSVSRWYSDRLNINKEFLRWSQALPQFVIYFDVKTTNATELDQIQSLLQDKIVKPAFYRIYLCDSDFNIFRTV